jgi:hypothetical protein
MMSAPTRKSIVSFLDTLKSQGVITVDDKGVVRLTRAAWVKATDSTRYAEEHDVVHFVGFKDDRWWNAIKIFGHPDFVHRFWDTRAAVEIMPGDFVVFADGDENQSIKEHAYDDSARF